MRKQPEGTLALLLGTFIWGMAFIAQSVGGELIGPFTFQAIRCLLGVIFLFLVSLLLEHKAGLAAALQKWKNPKLWRGGITCGVALFAAASQAVNQEDLQVCISRRIVIWRRRACSRWGWCIPPRARRGS